ncbi:hypothetical protein GGR58DRAFT_529536 [Xylaria digitata]|nr:hypothetical protein GGR58DRAFT_529536 [Xylaria digitata]
MENSAYHDCDHHTKHLLSEDLEGLIQQVIQLGPIGPLGLSYCGHDILVADVGYRYRTPRETNCALCQILEASRFSAEQQPGMDQYAENDRDGCDEIRATSFIRRFDLEYGELEEDSIIREEDTPLCLIVVLRDFPWVIGDDSIQLEEHMRSKGCAVLLQDGDESSFLAPQVVPPLFDPRRAKLWIRHCNRYHASSCNITPIPVRDFQVIDCVGLSIEEGELGVPYVALSYVWGDLEALCSISSEIQLMSRKLLDTGTYRLINSALIRTILVLSKTKIEQMDAIYHNAELTLVAAAGIDETHGLPGVGMKARAPQLIAKSRGVSVIWTMSDPQQSIISSRWSSRD